MTNKEIEKKQERQKKAIKVVKAIGIGLVGALLSGGFFTLFALGVKGCSKHKQVEAKEVIEAITPPVLTHKAVNQNLGYYYIQEPNNFNVYGSYGEEAYITDSIGNDDDAYIWVEYNRSNDYFRLVVYESNRRDIYFQVVNNQGNKYVSPLLYTNYGFNLSAYQGSEIWDYYFSQIFGTYEQYITTPKYQLDFNNVINPFGIFSTNNDYFIDNGGITGNVTIFKGLFSDIEGTMYKQINIQYVTFANGRYGNEVEYQNAPNNSGIVAYMGMYYITTDNREVFVNTYKNVVALGGANSGQPVRTKDNYWISSVYQHIYIYSYDTIGLSNVGRIPNTNPITLLSTLNNSQYGSGIIGQEGNNNIFGLLAMAFQSIASILAIQLFGGIPLYVLVFIPLVVTIVIFVVWLIKR